ncbi:MAG: acetyl-CoA carboxylase biotin carboxylase subunit family protein [Saprospiraceae bacterium]
MSSFLCLSEEFKGPSFLRTLKQLGHRVFLLTNEDARHDPWPRESIDEVFYAPRDKTRRHDRQTLVEGTAWLMRNHGIDRIVALDDFDVEDAALLREEFRIPGMGQTTARHFRDKLAMRIQAASHGIPIPQFSDLFRRESLEAFCAKNEGPYVIKPRSEASAAGIVKVANTEEALQAFDHLGEEAYNFLIETFAPGKVYHVDALTHDGKLCFSRASAYVDPPLKIVQGGGLFQTRTLAKTSKINKELGKLTQDVMKAFGMRYSASHTEFIEDAAGNFLLLETSSRVGGAYISDMLEHATGVDLWAEWAKLEAAQVADGKYKAPKDTGNAGAVTIRTVGVEHPDLRRYKEEEESVVALISKPYHAGLVFTAEREVTLAEVQQDIANRLFEQFG